MTPEASNSTDFGGNTAGDDLAFPAIVLESGKVDTPLISIKAVCWGENSTDYSRSVPEALCSLQRYFSDDRALVDAVKDQLHYFLIPYTQTTALSPSRPDPKAKSIDLFWKLEKFTEALVDMSRTRPVAVEMMMSDDEIVARATATIASTLGNIPLRSRNSDIDVRHPRSGHRDTRWIDPLEKMAAHWGVALGCLATKAVGEQLARGDMVTAQFLAEYFNVAGSAKEILHVLPPGLQFILERGSCTTVEEVLLYLEGLRLTTSLLTTPSRH